MAMTTKIEAELQWAEQLREVVDELEELNVRRAELLTDRSRLIVLGIQQGYDSQVGIAERSGLSRGRVQQLLNRDA